MERLKVYWRSGWVAKGIMSISGLAVLLILCCVAALAVMPSRTTLQPTPVVMLVPTEMPELTLAPEPIVTPAPTNAPAPSAVPTNEDRYVALAQSGVTIPSVRPSDVGKGAWSADVTDLGNGPEVTLTMPVGAGLDATQAVRQAKRQLAQAVKAIFDGDAAVVRVTAIGTYADGNDGSELPVASIFITREQYARWDGTAENLGDWRIAPRYQ